MNDTRKFVLSRSHLLANHQTEDQEESSVCHFANDLRKNMRMRLLREEVALMD